MVSRHLLLWDGWSGQLVFGELFRLYEQAGDDAAARRRPAGLVPDYLAWLADQDDAADRGRLARAPSTASTSRRCVAPGAGAPHAGAARHLAPTELSDELSDRVVGARPPRTA